LEKLAFACAQKNCVASDGVPGLDLIMAILSFIEEEGRLEEQEGGIIGFDGGSNELIALIVEDALPTAAGFDLSKSLSANCEARRTIAAENTSSMGPIWKARWDVFAKKVVWRCWLTRSCPLARPPGLRLGAHSYRSLPASR
jgi:hypothetical protein